MHQRPAATAVGEGYKLVGGMLITIGMLQLLAVWGIGRRAWQIVLGVSGLAFLADSTLALVPHPLGIAGILVSGLGLHRALLDRAEMAEPFEPSDIPAAPT